LRELDFESSASTSSAIRANWYILLCRSDCKYTALFYFCKFLGYFFNKKKENFPPPKSLHFLKIEYQQLIKNSK